MCKIQYGARSVAMNKPFYQKKRNIRLYLLFTILLGLFCLTFGAEAKPKDKSKAERSFMVITIPFSPDSLQLQIDALLETKKVSAKRERFIRWLLLPNAWERKQNSTDDENTWIRFIRVKSAVDQAAKGLHEVRFRALQEMMGDMEHLIDLYGNDTPSAVVAYVQEKLEFDAHINNLLPVLTIMKAMPVEIELISLNEYKKLRRKNRSKSKTDSMTGKGARFEF
jgi:hypothetical protein